MAKSLLEKITGRHLLVGQIFILLLSKPPTITRRGSRVVRMGALTDVEKMSLLENKKEEVFVKRFEGGNHCVVAEGENGEIVGYLWYSDDCFHLEERFNYRINIPADSIYSYDCFIKREYRLRGIWPLLQEYMIDQGRKLGRGNIITFVDLGNDPSLRAHLRFGYVLMRKILCVKFFTKNISMELDSTRDGSISGKQNSVSVD